MSLVDVRNAIAKHYRTALAGVQVHEHGGPLDLEELKRIGLRSPAAVVTCLGVPKLDVQGSVVVADVTFAVFCVASDGLKGKRDIGAMLLAEAVMVEAPNQRWSGTAARASRDVSAANLFSPKLDASDISLWAVRWRQQVDLERNAQTKLDDFVTFYGTYDIGQTDDTAVTEDQTELDQ